MKIPEQLQKMRFIEINPSNDKKFCKNPLESGWTKTKNYSYEEMSNNPNIEKYGVMCGKNNLLVLDCDSEQIQNKLMEFSVFQNTFIVKSAGKGLYHFYFFTDTENPSTKRLNIIDESDNPKRMLDIQGEGTQVLGPNSKIGDRYYEPVNNNEIKTVNYQELIDFLYNTFPEFQEEKSHKKVRKRKTAENEEEYEELDPVISYIKSKITIRDILEEYDIDTKSGKNCECPFHSSENGVCFSYDTHIFNCFHCGRSGTIFDLIMYLEKCDFITAKNILSEKVGMPPKIIKEAKDMIKRAKKAEATEYVVKQIFKNNNIYTIKDDIKSEMWIYVDGIYIPNAKCYIKNFCRGMFGDFYTTHLANQVISKIETDTYIEEQDFFNVKYKNLVPVMNGILDIKNKKLKSFSPDMIFFNKIPVYYDPSIIKMSNIMNFLKSTLKRDTDIQTIQELCGYILSNSCKFKKAFIFNGTGDNGKSVLLDLISTFIGGENISNVSLQNLDSDQYSASELFGKMVNIHSDIGSQEIQETSMLKTLISGDIIYANRKFLSPLKFSNHAKMIFSANEIPKTSDDTDGFFTRWVIIDFPYSFKRKIDYDELSEEDKNSGIYFIADENILEKITTENELTAMLNWALCGYDRLEKNKEFSNVESINERRAMWHRKASPMLAFLHDCCEITCDMDDYVISNELHMEYARYCKQNKLKPEIKKECTKILNREPIKYTTRKLQTKTNNMSFYENKRVWEGIRFK